MSADSINPRKTFGVVADLKRGIAVSGAFLCPVCDGDGELALSADEVPTVCPECGGQGWIPDDVPDDTEDEL